MKIEMLSSTLFFFCLLYLDFEENKFGPFA